MWGLLMIVSAVAISRKGFADELAILGASGSVGREIAVEEEQRAIA